ATTAPGLGRSHRPRVATNDRLAGCLYHALRHRDTPRGENRTAGRRRGLRHRALRHGDRCGEPRCAAPGGRIMRIAIAGAGAVGSSIATELLEAGHTVMLVERSSAQFKPEVAEQADWVLGDACEFATLEEAGIERCDVVIAAT